MVFLWNINAMMDLGYRWKSHPSWLRMPRVMTLGILACMEPSEKDRKTETC